MRDAAHYKHLADDAMKDRSWILCADVAVAFTDWIKRLREVGMPRPLIICGITGTGEMPGEDDAEVVVLGTSGETMLGGIRAYHAALRDLPSWAIEKVDAWDPERQAVVLPSFLDTAVDIGGRPNWAPRKPEWLALEDKTLADEIWYASGVDHAPSTVVPATPDELIAASRDLADPEGVVWTSDNRDGWHGGAEYTRYVRDPDDAAETITFMEEHAHRVRVMPFLEGVPASIHGMVFPDAVAAFRPVEMLVYRVPERSTFRYSGAATSWDPSAGIREEMREAARRVGSHLRERVGYRGAFTIDGVVTPGGFLPTELNPRFGAGLGPVSRGVGIPLLTISRLLVAGERLDEMDAASLEEIILTAADETRAVGGMAITPVQRDDTETRRAHWDGTTVSPVGEDEGNATIMRGPTAMGTMFRFSLDEEAVPVGQQAAPILMQAFAAFDELWDAGIGELIPGSLVS